MKYSEVMCLLGETHLSPELLAKQIAVSNSTYRRWQKTDPNDEFPLEYKQNIAMGIYKLLQSKSLSYDSKRVNNFVEGNLPEYFQAAIGRIKNKEEIFSENSDHQDKVTAILSNLGSSSNIRNQVDKSSKKILNFTKWGEAWKERIGLMTKVITSKKISLVDQLVAYGALFYLILPFDLIPDSIPIFGYVDDFGILGFAASYYYKRFPDLANNNS